MAKRKIEIFLDITTEKELESAMNNYYNSLICAQIYCTYFGYCTALDPLFQNMKLDWSDGEAVLLRVAVDEIRTLERFWGRSIPVFLFILNRRIISIFQGVDNIRFEAVAKREISLFRTQKEGRYIERPTYDISEPTPEEIEWSKARQAETEEAVQNALEKKNARQAARKRHRAELMVPQLQHLNFVLYWPHSTHAHPELYEKWDPHNIIMVGREEIQLSREVAEDVLYAGDAPMNEASMHFLLSSPALAICFRILDTDKHFVSLVRKILYEDLHPLDESVPATDQPRPRTAFDVYKSYSLSKEKILRRRREEKVKRREQAKENRARRLSEMQRLARQAIEEAIQAKRAQKERQKLELLKAGNLAGLEDSERNSLESDIDITIPEELSDAEVEEESEENDENEYFPPAGLVIPGFYAPSNDIAKVNGLAILFPKIVSEFVTPQPEFLPPHVLVLIDFTKRYKAIESLAKYRNAVIHMGIFKTMSPYSSLHVAYTVRQFDSLNLSINMDDMKLAFMLSITIDLPLLELMELNPYYVSRNPDMGEEECAAMFPVDYGDDYPEFEDFEFLNMGARLSLQNKNQC